MIIGDRLVEIALEIIDIAAEEPGFLVVGQLLDGLVQVGQRFFVFALVRPGVPAFAQDFGKIGLDFQRPLEILHRLVRLALAEIDETAHEIDRRFLGREFHGQIHVGQRLGRIFQHRVGVRPIAKAFDVVRIELQRARVIGRRARPIAHMREGRAAAEIGRRIGGIQTQGAIQIGQRGADIAQLDFRVAAVAVGFGVIGRQLDGGVVIGDGLFDLAFLQIGEAAVEIAAIGGRCELDRLVQIGERLVVLALHGVADAAVAIGGGELGIQLQGLVELLDGAVRFAFLEQFHAFFVDLGGGRIVFPAGVGLRLGVDFRFDGRLASVLPSDLASAAFFLGGPIRAEEAARAGVFSSRIGIRLVRSALSPLRSFRPREFDRECSGRSDAAAEADHAKATPNRVQFRSAAAIMLSSCPIFPIIRFYPFSKIADRRKAVYF